MLPPMLRMRLREELGDRSDQPCILELPFSAARFRQLLEEAEARLRRLADIPHDYAVLFLQGGASAQFALVPLNLLGDAGCADYIETGYWSRRAIEEARGYGRIDVAASNEADGCRSIPPRAAWQLNPRAAYLHITSNETADGVEYASTPEVGDVPLVSDMTASFLTRPIDVSRYGLIYASAQKNLGASGLTIVLVRRDLLDRAHPHTPSVFHYARQTQAGSRLNTPPTFAIYLAGLMLQWLEQEGGLTEMARRARQRSESVYAAIDGCGGFYRCPIGPDARSRISLCFRPHDERLTPILLDRAREAGLLNLYGHARIGGLRDCLYNAMPVEGARGLAQWLRDFARLHG
jgi:phosphoserine aminotransferase